MEALDIRSDDPATQAMKAATAPGTGAAVVPPIVAPAACKTLKIPPV
jgi:hypothetical protein